MTDREPNLCDPLDDLIDMTVGDGSVDWHVGQTRVPAPAAVAKSIAAAGYPVNPAAARPLKPVRPKRTTDSTLHYKWFTAFLDNHDWHLACSATGVPYQITNERIEKFLNRSGAWNDPANLPKLRAFELAEYREGRTPKLYGRPRRCRHNRSVAIRLDADAHEGELDAAALIQWIQDTYLPDLYQEPSDRGWSGYAVIEFPPKSHTRGGDPVYPSRHAINALLDRFHRALQALAATRFRAKIEVCGRFATPVTYDDGTKGMPSGHRGSTIKVPKCPRPGDPGRLWGSKLPVAVVERVLRDADALAAQPMIDSPVPPAKKRRKCKVERVVDTGDKHQNRLNCLLSAKRELFGDIDPAELAPAEIERWNDRFNEIYHAAGLNGGERDRDRDAWARDTMKWMARTHDSDAVGHGLWFTLEQDYPRALELVRSTFSKRLLRTVNRANANKLGGEGITYHALALASLTIMKNIHTDRPGEVPVKS